MRIGTAVLKNFENTIAYKELNLLAADIAEGGILKTSDMFTPSILGGTISIASGVAVFNGGTILRISDAVSFSAADGFIYAAYSAVTRTGGVYYSTTEPRSEYIPICTISEGIVTDTRRYAKYKIAKPEGNTFVACAVGTGSSVSPSWTAQATYEMQDDFEAAIIKTQKGTYNVWRCIELIDGEESEQFSLKLYSRGSSTKGDTLNCYGKISRSGRTLTFWARLTSSTSDPRYPQYALAEETFYLV